LATKPKIHEAIITVYQWVNKLMYAEKNYGVKEVIEINTS
jgi:hypothetical protein